MSETYFQPDESPYEEGYVVVFNHITTNKDLSDSAYRLLNYLHSNSPTWVVRGRFTAKELGWGKEKLTKSIRELYNLGFITRIQIRENGRFKHFVYKYSYKQKFKNEPWASPKKRDSSNVSNVGESCPKPDLLTPLALEGLQPERVKSTPVKPTPEIRPIPKPNIPMPKLHGYEGNASLSKSSRAMEAWPVKDSLPSRKRKHKRKEDHENRFQYLLGLNICDETGVVDEDEMSFLAYTYTQKQLDDAYFHLQHKIDEKGFKAKSTIAIFKHLLKNEHNARGANADLNLAFAKKFAKEVKWGSLEFKDRYVIDRNNPSKDIDFNLEPATFRDILGQLYMSLNANYGT